MTFVRRARSGYAGLPPAARLALAVAIAYVVLVEVGVQLIFGRIDLPKVDVGWIEVGRLDRPLPRALFLSGATTGALYGLVGIGLILVYRANRIINFAQAQLGAVPATLALMLLAFKGWPYWAVLPIVLFGPVLLGAVVEMLFIRRFSKSPRLILTVVTIGVGIVLQVAEFLVKDWLSSGDLTKALGQQYRTPFARFTHQIGPLVFTGDHVVTVVVVLALAAALAAFFRFTDIGVAVRASAENADRASLLGIPVRRISTIVWVLAAVLSAVGVFLRAPLIGIPVTGFVGPEILLFGLAAAVIARMESMPLAVFAGMGIGIVEQSAVFSTKSSSLTAASMFAVILAALLLQRGRLARAFDTGVETWQAAREVRPIPTELRDVPAVRRARAGVWAAVVAGVLLTPFVVGDSQTGLATKVVLFSMIGVSLVILTGWTGQISLGQLAIAGVGSAVAGGLAANHHWDFFATLVVAGVAGAVTALLIGLPALRIQGLFLAVTTLAFAFTVPNLLLNPQYFGWLLPDQGSFAERPVLYGRFDLTTDSHLLWFDVRADAKFFYLCAIFLALVLGVAHSLRRYRSGRILIGARDNAKVMQAFGVNVALTRLTAFALSGFIAAIAGALLAFERGSVPPEGFLPETSIQVFLMTVIGGVASLPGAVLGAIYVLGLPLLPVLRDIELIELLTSGVGVMLVLMVLPGGFADGMFRVRDAFLRRVAAREGIHVPSLVADSLIADGATEQAITEASHHVESVADAPPLEGAPA